MIYSGIAVDSANYYYNDHDWAINPVQVLSAGLQFLNAHISGYDRDFSNQEAAINSIYQDLTPQLTSNLGTPLAFVTGELFSSAKQGFTDLSFKITGDAGGTVQVFLSQPMVRTLVLHVDSLLDHIKGTPEQLARVKTFVRVNGQDLLGTDYAEVVDLKTRQVLLTIELARFTLPPLIHHFTVRGTGTDRILVRDDGVLVDPTLKDKTFWVDFDSLPPPEQEMLLIQIITAPVSPGVSTTIGLDLDLVTGRITRLSGTNGATEFLVVRRPAATAGQELHDGNSDGPEVLYTVNVINTHKRVKRVPLPWLA